MAPRHTRHSALSALAIGAVLTLSACGGAGTAAPSGSDPSSTPTPTIDTRPTPASSTAPARNIPIPELPQAATQNTKEGFKAFVEHYIALLNYAYQTGDTKPALTAGDPECTMCKTVTGDVQQSADSGTWMVGGKIMLNDLWTDGVPDIDKRYSAIIKLAQSEWVNFNAAGEVAKNPGSTITLLAVGEYRGGAWHMWDLGTVPGAKS